MIETPLSPPPPSDGSGASVTLPPDPQEGQGYSITEDEDGGVIIEYEQAQMEGPEISFEDNLANHIDEGELSSLGSELVSLFEDDKRSREDWEKAYIKGLKLLGFQMEDRMEPWPNACGVYHPILSEAIIRFQSQAIMELFPASGPVRTRIIGEATEDRQAQARRVEEYMNYMLTTRMREYRSEHEQMLFYLALAGSAFKKVYQDYVLGRPASAFVPAEDFVVSYATTDLSVSPRYTHVMRRTANEIRKLQVAGVYSDCDLGEPKPQAVSSETLQKEYDKIQGFTPGKSHDDRFVILEMHVDLDLAGFEDVDQHSEMTGIELPYVVTVEKDSRKILSIRRNFRQDDPLKIKRDHFVHYKYIPGLGFYGFGLIHLIGGIAKSATSILRQLVDSGTLSNLPGGFKARGLRIKSDDSPIMPGEWRDVDVPGQAIRDNILPLPYKEPSAVLQALLGEIVDEGRRFASIADLDVGDGNQEAPVGTTLALIERSMKVMSAIHARLHASQGFEFSLLADLIEEYTPESYEYDVQAGRQIKKADFDERIDIIPVSDPNATSFAQRLMTQTTALQIAGQAPQLYDLRALHRQMMETLGIDDIDKVIPDPDKATPADPLSENASAIKGDSLKAFEYQNHQAHISIHQAILQDPSLQQMPTFQGTSSLIIAHIAEHMAFQYRQEVAQKMGIQLPPMGQPMPPQIEAQLAPQIAQAVQAVTQDHQQQAQQAQAQQQMQDPMFQLKQQEVQIKAQDVQRKAAEADKNAQIDVMKAQLRLQGERERLATQEKIAKGKMAVDLVNTRHQSAVDMANAHQKSVVELVKPTLRAPQETKPK